MTGYVVECVACTTTNTTGLRSRRKKHTKKEEVVDVETSPLWRSSRTHVQGLSTVKRTHRPIQVEHRANTVSTQPQSIGLSQLALPIRYDSGTKQTVETSVRYPLQQCTKSTLSRKDLYSVETRVSCLASSYVHRCTTHPCSGCIKVMFEIRP